MSEYDFRTFTFGTGAHKSREEGLCVMEAVSLVAGEEHSDHPACACPLISAFLRSWNDSIADDDRRRELLSPFVFRLVGTRATKEIQQQRSWMTFDWVVRECAAEFLSLSDTLKPHAEAMRSLPEINQSNFDLVVPILAAARAAAWAAAREAAGAAAREAAGAAAMGAARGAAGEAAGEAAGAAAREAAWVAAGEAARAAAREAARAAAWAAARAAARAAAGAAAWEAAREAAEEAARAAAWEAAGAAAGEAARAAAGAAAREALQPSVERLQQSAFQLVDRMIRLTEPQERVPVRELFAVEAD